MTSPYFAKHGVADVQKKPEAGRSSSIPCTDCKSDSRVENGMRICVNPACDWWTIVPVREQQVP